MQAENRFIKLLLLSTAEGEVLLYGFSSPTAAFALETESCIEKVSKRSYSDPAFS